MSILQETARTQFEAKKVARRQVHQQVVSRNNEWQGNTTAHTSDLSYHVESQRMLDGRLRSGSGGSKTTTSESSDIEGIRGLHQLRSYGSSSPLVSTSRLPPIPSSTGTSFTAAFPPSSASSINSLVTPQNPASVLSPIANRVREKDAGAMAAYLSRNRSGSASTQSESKTSNSAQNSSSPSPAPMGVPPSASSGSGLPFPLANRRLRPSASAAQLRTTPLPLPIVTSTLDQQTPRNRSGTTPTSVRPNQPAVSPLEGSFVAAGASPLSSTRTLERRSSNRRAGILGSRPIDVEDYTGPSRDYAIFPEPPPHADPPTTSKANIASARRAALALLSKPLPNIDQRVHREREHRRVTSTSDTRT